MDKVKVSQSDSVNPCRITAEFYNRKVTMTIDEDKVTDFMLANCAGTTHMKVECTLDAEALYHENIKLKAELEAAKSNVVKAYIVDRELSDKEKAEFKTN